MPAMDSLAAPEASRPAGRHSAQGGGFDAHGGWCPQCPTLDTFPMLRGTETYLIPPGRKSQSARSGPPIKSRKGLPGAGLSPR